MQNDLIKSKEKFLDTENDLNHRMEKIEFDISNSLVGLMSKKNEEGENEKLKI